MPIVCKFHNAPVICAGCGSFIFGFFQASITLEPKDQKLIGQVNQLEPSENERYIEPKKMRKLVRVANKKLKFGFL